MKTHVRRIVRLGELVAAAYDMAARYSTDPREVSLLATRAVARLLQRGRKTSTFTVLLDSAH